MTFQNLNMPPPIISSRRRFHQENIFSHDLLFLRQYNPLSKLSCNCPIVIVGLNLRKPKISSMNERILQTDSSFEISGNKKCAGVQLCMNSKSKISKYLILILVSFRAQEN